VERDLLACLSFTLVYCQVFSLAFRTQIRFLKPFVALSYARARPSYRRRVRLSVTRWWCVKTDDPRIMRLSPTGSPGTLVQHSYPRSQELQTLTLTLTWKAPRGKKTQSNHASVLTAYRRLTSMCYFSDDTWGPAAIGYRPATASAVRCFVWVHCAQVIGHDRHPAHVRIRPEWLLYDAERNLFETTLSASIIAQNLDTASKLRV